MTSKVLQRLPVSNLGQTVLRCFLLTDDIFHFIFYVLLANLMHSSFLIFHISMFFYLLIKEHRKFVKHFELPIHELCYKNKLALFLRLLCLSLRMGIIEKRNYIRVTNTAQKPILGPFFWGGGYSLANEYFLL